MFRIGIWEKDGEIVAVAAYGMQLGEAYLMVKSGYDFLYPEMVKYSEDYLYSIDANGQKAVLQESFLRYKVTVT